MAFSVKVGLRLLVLETGTAFALSADVNCLLS